MSHYVGADIVADLVVQNKMKFAAHPNMSFLHFDAVKEVSESAFDLVIAKDVFIHLPPLDVIKALENISNSGSKYS